VFNGALFILLGLQLRSIFRELAIFPAATLVQYGAAIVATVIVVRIVWVFAIAGLRRAVDRRADDREGGPPSNGSLFVVGWAGMRGIVSLAAALSIPETVAGGAPFPARDLILFLTFVVILATLLGQGLSLPWLLRRLTVAGADAAAAEVSVSVARVRVAEAALRRLSTLEAAFTTTVHWEVAGRLQAKFSSEVTHFQAHVDGAAGADDAAEHEIERGLVREAIAAQRAALDDMRYGGEISDEIFRRMQYDIDLAETRLVV
jgi:CPA1 family monovalent cation:H+ antiporter